MAQAGIEISGKFDVSDIVDGFDDVGVAAKGMDDDVAQAAAGVDTKMGSIADSADNLGSSSSQAAGGLGDLGGALSAVPGPLGAVGTGMETLAPLVMGVTGATDLLNLAANSNIVVTTKQKAAAIGHAVATKAQAAASKVAAVGQWALNAALSANPIGLVVLAVAALVAGFVLAYKKSETFRNIVGTAMGAAKKAIQLVVDKVGNIIDKVGDAAGLFPDLSTAVGVAKDLVVGYFKLMTTPITTVIDLVKDLIDWISKIDFPDAPDLTPWNRSSAGGAAGAVVAGGGLTQTVVNVSALLDPRQTQQLAFRHNLALGYPVV